MFWKVRLLQPFPLLGLNSSLVVAQPEVSEVVLEAQPDVPAFGLSKVGIVLIKIPGGQPGIGLIQQVLQVQAQLRASVPEGFPKPDGQCSHGIQIIRPGKVIGNINEDEYGSEK